MRWLVPLAVVFTIAAPAAGQMTPSSPDVALRAALKAYKAGDTKQAVAGIVAIPTGKLKDAVHELIRTELRARQFDVLEVAAIALTESAAASIEQPGTTWRELKELGDEVGLQLIASGDSSAALRAWCLATEALGEGLRDFVTLTPLMADARNIFRNDPEVLLASGSLFETRAYALAGDVGPKGRDVSIVPPQIKPTAGFNTGMGWWVDDLDRPANLKRARDYYNQVLNIAPKCAEARVRLARVLHQLGDLPGALAALDALPSTGLSQELMYLSRLFRAGIEEDLGHRDQAKAAYLAALEWRAQAPFVGLAALLRSGGDPPASLTVTQRLFHDAPDEDPWWSYLRGQGAHLNERLVAARAAVR